MVELTCESPTMTQKPDIKQFRQACREAGLTDQQRYTASKALHAEKGSSRAPIHMAYRELLVWLRQWKQHQWQS